MHSTVVKKLRKFPIKAIPDGPRKTAKILDVISPIPILINTLILFKELTLNNCEEVIFLKELN
ncbi:hypothetical protein FPKKA176_contig00013-0013 [Flavobacterium psychrophilum]|nr:DNA primase/polymerase [Flavobacterium psychrophilum]GAW90340.1 hypothetical protein FPS14_contig00053-0013 [Flavobacterium psychrophilum]GEJ30807.1 hypothetical protein FPN184_contig00005-0104 [Flavobacterium psychrophilum]GEJ32056.1 hypothetical protein FPN181_contig00061-0006 [Flavobacterium psychrophilum]GEJ35092.1 hypothetical protein FPN185_contig00117-0006 [Flavobacterium psychrophilum]